MKTVEIKRSELRQLVFWAIIGFAAGNGGSYEKTIANTIAKNVKLTEMKRGELPYVFRTLKSQAPLTGETYDKLKEKLGKDFPDIFVGK
jgi:hypothetical protein